MLNDWTKMSLKYSAIAASLALIAACGVQVEGDEGNLTFHYIDSGWPQSASTTDIAKGAQVDVRVSDARADDNTTSLELIEAYSDDAQTLEVAAERDEEFQLAAHEESAGDGTRIHAEAYDADGEAISDSTTLRTAGVDDVAVDHLCDDEVYLAESTVEFGYDMMDAAGDDLTGYGYYPLSIEPESAGEIDEGIGRLEVIEIETGDEAGTHDIVSDLDDEVVQEFELLASEDIDDIEFHADHEERESSLDVGESGPAMLFSLLSDDRTVCGAKSSAIELVSNTPDTCEVDYGTYRTLHLAEVEGLEAGECEIELSIPDTEISETMTIDIE